MAFNTRVCSASSRRNTTPTSSTLNMVIEDIDCSGLDAVPEDGEFIVCQGTTAVEVEHHDAASTADLTRDGAQLRMVWGSALRSDRSALGDTRVPVVMHGGGRFKTKLFMTGAAETPETAAYIPGAELGVHRTDTDVSHQGSENRLLLCPAEEIGTAAAWVVGYVVAVTNSSSVSGTAEIEIQLYPQPRPSLVPTA